MFEYAILALLGLAFGAAIIDLTDNDDDAPPPEEPEAPVGQTIEIAESETGIGGEGDDTITGGYVLGADGNGGDDEIRLEILDGGQATGGEGNDLIAVMNGYDAEISGDDGDDTVIGGGGDRMDFFGGAGDDLFSLDLTHGYSEHFNADGGAGDDTFDVTVHFDDSNTQVAPVLTGGAGADTFNVTLLPLPVTAGDQDDPHYDGTATVVSIDDFTPGEDVLSVTLPEFSAASYNGASLNTDTANNLVELVLSYNQVNADGQSVEARAIIQLVGAAGLEMSDIVMVGA